MENQPTAILLLFTDFLNNLDSIAFFRLSSSLWAAHRSPAGRYRLKPSEDGKFLRPSSIPAHSIESPLSSPSSGHFLLSFLHLDDLSDFSLFLPGASGDEEKQEKQKIFRNIKTLDIKVNEIEKMMAGGTRIPSSVEKVRLFGPCPPSLSVKALKDFLPVEGKILDISQTFKIQSNNIEDADFSNFPRLEELKLWPGFNYSLRPSSSGPSPFPATLRLLHFYASFNKILPEGILPDNLEELQFSSFNQPLPSRLPRNLRVLKLGGQFDFPIKPGQLPEGLKILRFSARFNRPLELNTFPPGIEEITFSPIYNHPLLPGLFPSSLKILHFHCREFSHPIVPGVLPEALENLTLILRPEYSYPRPSLPSGLNYLSVDEIFPAIQSVGHFPSQVRQISFDNKFNSPLPVGILPSSLETINFGYNYDQPLPVGLFPQGIRSISIGEHYSHPLEVGLFPSSVRKLRISTSHPLPMGIFPEGIDSISFCPGFNQKLLPGIFPSSLRRLTFMESFDFLDCRFSHDLLPGVLPPHLFQLNLGPTYFSYFPASALPPYFLPDSLSSSQVFHRLEVPAEYAEAEEAEEIVQDDEVEESEDDDFSAFYRSSIVRLFSRIGGDGEFLLKTLRASISSENEYFSNSSNQDYFLAEPRDGRGEGFIIHKRLIAAASD